MNYYLGLALAILGPLTILAGALGLIGARDRRLVRQSVSLADRRIAILSPRKARALEKALVSFLSTTVGSVVAEDPRIIDRLDLFWTVRTERRTEAPLSRRMRAEMTRSARLADSRPHRRRIAEEALGLAPLPATA